MDAQTSIVLGAISLGIGVVHYETEEISPNGNAHDGNRRSGLSRIAEVGAQGSERLLMTGELFGA